MKAAYGVVLLFFGGIILGVGIGDFDKLYGVPMVAGGVLVALAGKRLWDEWLDERGVE